MGIYETLKDVISIAQKADNIELLKQVLSLQSQVNELQQENQTLRKELAEADRQGAFAKTMRFEKPFYFAEGDAVPFCARCWETDRRAVHLKDDWNGKRWECYTCKNVYLLEDTARPRVMFKSL